MILLTDEKHESYEEQWVLCHICQKAFCSNKNHKNDENGKNEEKLEKHLEVKDHCHYTVKFRGTDHSICYLIYKLPKNIPIVIHNAWYDTQFIVQQFAEEFKGESECTRENMESILLFLYRFSEHGNGKTTTHKLKFIDSFRFMPTSLSNLVDNLLEINEEECKACMNG